MNLLKSEFSRLALISKWVLSIYFKNYPVQTFVFIVTELVLSLGNLLNAYIIAIVTDKAIGLMQSNNLEVKNFIPILILIIGSYLFFEFLRIINRYVWRYITYQDYHILRKMLADRLIFLGVQNLENPEITNKSQRFNEELGNISGFLELTVIIFTGFVSFVSAGIVLINTIPFVAFLFSFVMVFQFVVNQKYIRALWIFGKDSTEERRKANTSIGLLSEPAPLKELILSGGNKYLTTRFMDYLSWAVIKVDSIWKKLSTWQVIAKILDASVFGYGIIVILQRLVSRVISIGQLTFEIRSLRIFADSFVGFTLNLVQLRENSVRLNDIYDLFTKYDSEKDGDDDINYGSPQISLNSVSFKYPNSKKYVLKDLDLIIKTGEKVAIVGENGAGKTTLIKLLCRFYRANSGEIKLGNLNINDIKISSWYKNLAILFQDYTMYTHLSVRENIEIDSTDKISTDETINNALKKADALDFVKKYKNGINQILSERYKGGTRPSTGQWQKIAIARVFHRNAPVLILDEPTASIDAVAEAQIFDNIYKFSKGKTVIIISHRFSTVRNADRIIVLDKGKIIEQGSHEELLKNNGKYAKAFKLQARGYQ